MKLCKICCLPPARRAKIDAALVDGVTYKRIAAKFSTREQNINSVNLCRHRKHLLPKELVRQAPPPPPETALTLLQRVESLVGESRAIASAARTAEQWIAATSALREVRCCLELLGKLTGELAPGAIFNFNFANLREEHVLAFLEAVGRLPASDPLRALVMDKLGDRLPVIKVNYTARCLACGKPVDEQPPQLEAAPLLEAMPINGHGHA